MRGPPTRQTNSDAEQIDVLIELGCPKKRPKRLEFVWLLPITPICSEFRWAAACADDSARRSAKGEPSSLTGLRRLPTHPTRPLPAATPSATTQNRLSGRTAVQRTTTGRGGRPLALRTAPCGRRLQWAGLNCNPFRKPDAGAVPRGQTPLFPQRPPAITARRPLTLSPHEVEDGRPAVRVGCPPVTRTAGLLAHEAASVLCAVRLHGPAHQALWEDPCAAEGGSTPSLSTISPAS